MAPTQGRISAGGVEKDVGFISADPGLNAEIDAAYHTKYRRHQATYINMMVSREARTTTIKLTPRRAQFCYKGRTGERRWSSNMHDKPGTLEVRGR